MQNKRNLVDHGWGQMAEILDREMPQKKKQKKFLWIMLAFLAVSTVVGGVYYGQEMIDDKDATRANELSVPQQVQTLENDVESTDEHPEFIDNTAVHVDELKSSSSTNTTNERSLLASNDAKSTYDGKAKSVVQASNFQDIQTKEVKENKVNLVKSENSPILTNSNQMDYIQNDESKGETSKQSEIILALAESEDENRVMAEEVAIARSAHNENQLIVEPLSNLSWNPNVEMNSIIEPQATNTDRRMYASLNVGTLYLTQLKSLGYSASVLSNIGGHNSSFGFTTGIGINRFNFEQSFERDFDVTSSPITGSPDNFNEVYVKSQNTFIANTNVINYLTLPTIFTYRKTRMHFGLGIMHSFLFNSPTNANAIELANDTNFESSEANNLEIQLNKYRVSMIAESSFYINKRLTINLAYVNDFSGLFVANPNVDKIQLSHVKLGIGYQFYVK